MTEQNMIQCNTMQHSKTRRFWNDRYLDLVICSVRFVDKTKESHTQSPSFNESQFGPDPAAAAGAAAT